MNWLDILDRYGIPVAIILAFGYVVWTKLIPYVVTQLSKQQEFLFSEIQRLQSEAREDKRIVMDLVRQGNENTTKLQSTLEKMSERMESLSNDISEVYKMVARDKRLINGNKDYYGEKE